MANFGCGFERGLARDFANGFARDFERDLERDLERGFARDLERDFERDLERGLERGFERGGFARGFERSFASADVYKSKTPYGISVKVVAPDVPFNGSSHRVIYVKSAIPSCLFAEVKGCETTHALSVFKPLGGFFTWTFNDAKGEHVLKIFSECASDVPRDMELARAWQPLIADIMEELLPALLGFESMCSCDLGPLRDGAVKMRVEVVA